MSTGPFCANDTFPDNFSEVRVLTKGEDGEVEIGPVSLGSGRPMGAQAHLAMKDSVIVVGVSDEDSVSVFSVSGAHLYRVGFTPQRVSVTPELYLAAVEHAVGRSASSEDGQRQTQEIIEQIPPPEIAPQYRALLVGPTVRSGWFALRGGPGEQSWNQ